MSVEELLLFEQKTIDLSNKITGLKSEKINLKM